MNTPIISIDSSRRYCVYAHRYRDEIFYVGSGKTVRPFATVGRNVKWKEYVDQIDSFIIDIMLWTEDRSEAYSKEQELIRTLKPLCNLNGFGPSEPMGIAITGFSQSDIDLIDRAAGIDKPEHFKANRSDWIRSTLLKAAEKTVEDNHLDALEAGTEDRKAG